MSEELRPCPFCKSNNTTLDYYEISGPQELGTIVVCNDCGASAKSIVDWNTRPIEDALNARIAELEAARRWIPVSERLPEDRVTILAAFNNREILTAKYYKYYEGFGSVENYWRIEGWHSGNVTHWMPLPEPPIVYGKECEE